ncbi:retrovirus-related pol polyprotein from transposon TNT 1-94 [Tanacetum coccineum]
MDELIAHVSEKTYAYGVIRAENQNLLFTISELKTRLANVEKGKSVNTKFWTRQMVTQRLLCVTPLHKHVIQKKIDVQKSKENHVVSKPVTLQTSPAKQSRVNSNKNVIAPGMYKVVTTHESQTNEAKHNLSSTGMNVASSVRRPMNKDSHVKNSILANSKKPAKKVAVYVRKNNKQITHLKMLSQTKENVNMIDVANASKAKIFHKTRFSKESTLSKSLDTTYIVSKPKIDVGSTLKANDKWLFKAYDRLDLVDGLPKFKYGKDHLCSAYERGKSKKASHPLKLVPSDHSKLELLHMDLCGPLRVASINGKKHILVIVDDYSRYTWVYFLHSKDETLEIIKKFIAQAQLNYKAKVCKIRTDNGTEFKNATLKAHYEKLGIMQQFSTARTRQQNGVVERRNRTLVEAARTMLIFSRLPEFLWAEAVATACFTQNCSLCYLINNRDDLGKMKPKADIRFDELTTMASEHDCLEPELQRFINHNSSAETMNTPSKEDFDNLFGPMYEEYFEKKFFDTPINSAAQPTQIHEDSPSTSLIIVDEHEVPPIFVLYNPPSHEEIESSTTALEPSNVQNFHQVQPSTHIWTKDHPLNQVTGDLSKPVMTRQRLHTDSKVCMYALTVNTIEPKNIKEAMADHSWIKSMQNELNQFERLQVWELVPPPEGKNIIALKWLWKNKCDAENIVV